MSSCGPAFFGASLSAVADPFWADVVLMLDCAGVDASTTFIDLSPAANTVIADGAAQVETADVPPGGGNSVLFSNPGDRLRVLSSASLAFGTGPLTFEMWVSRNSSANFFTFAGQNWNVYYSTIASSLRFWDGATDRITGGSHAFLTWQHLALVRDAAGNVYLWNHGVQEGSTWANPGPTNLTASDVLIGHYPASAQYFQGSAAQIRATRQARYTAPFTPPPPPFPLF